MKTKNENKKFTLEKFEVAKLQSLKKIVGGNDPLTPTHDTDDTSVDPTNTGNTNTVKTPKNSSLPCIAGR